MKLKKRLSRYSEYFEKQDKKTRLMILISGFGILLFIAIATSLPINNFLSNYFPKFFTRAVLTGFGSNIYNATIPYAGTGAIATPPPPPPSPPAGTIVNLLQNASFESGLTSWPIDSVTSTILSTTDKRTGVNAVRVGSPTLGGYVGQFLTLVPGKNYVATAWVKKSVANSGFTSFGPVFRNGTTILSETTVPVTDSAVGAYTQLAVPFTVPATTTSTQIGLYADAGSYYIYMDDLQVYDPTPPTPTPTKIPTPTVTPTKIPTPIPTSAPAALIQNGGFESGSTSWAIETPTTVTVNSSAPRTGTKNISLGGSSTSYGYISQSPTLIPGRTYTLSGWFRKSALSADNGLFGITFRDANNLRLSSSVDDLSITSTTYTNITRTFTIPSNATKTQVGVFKFPGSAYVYGDDISLTLIPITPTAVPTKAPTPTKTPVPTATPTVIYVTVQNPSFESAITYLPWYVDGTVLRVSGGRSGSAARMDSDGSYLSQDFPASSFVVGRKYTASAWVYRTSTNGFLDLYVPFFNTAGTQITGAGQNVTRATNTAPYQKVSYSFNMPSGLSKVQIGFYNGGSGSTYIDDVTITKDN